jgi:GNAT superfamily N-acetyltransferase
MLILSRLTRLFIRIVRRIFYYSKTNIYIISAKDAPVHKINLDISLVQVNENNINDALMMTTEKHLQNFRKMLFDYGYLGFYAYCGNVLVHHAWVILGPYDIVPASKGKKSLFRTDLDSAYIYYCATAKDWRGKGIYTFVLSEICRILEKDFNLQRLFIATSQNNHASSRGIQKANFKAYRNYTVLNIFGFIIKKIELIVDISDY